MNVLSVFDGMSCGMLALRRLGLRVDRYFASEINKHAITVSKNNWFEIEHIGSVVDVKAKNLPKIDLLIGGSPCQGFSFAGKQLNFDDPRSVLFFEFVRLLKEIRETNPQVKFFLENVKMKKEYEQVITQLLGVDPVEVNSHLVSAQNRKRLYWTNIVGFEMPKDKGIFLKDIVHEFTEEILHFEMPKFNIHPSGKGMNGEVYSILKPKSNTLTTNKGEGQKISVAFNQYVLSGKFSEWFAAHADERIRKKYMSLDATKAITMTARQFANWNGNFIFETLSEYIVPFDSTLKIIEKEVEQGKVGYFRKDSQANRVYFIHGKSVTLCGDAGGGAAKMGQYLFGCLTPNRVEKRQNGQRFNDGKKFYTLTANDSHGILIEGYIRKLTPIECERLQTVPDNYTGGVSDSQRYQMLGNGWTVDVICEFFKHLK
jgi:DNA-cytosine methyltransferase